MPRPKAFVTRVPMDTARPVRVDVFLAARFRYFSRVRWQRVIRKGEVLLDGQSCAPASLVRSGQEITYTPSPTIEPEIKTDFSVIYEDDHLMVVNKPAPCPTVKTGRYLYHTLEHLIEQYLGGAVGKRFWMMHRLDMETSGAVMIAKRDQARAHLYREFFYHRVGKTYLCVTRGTFPLLSHFQELPLGLISHSRIRIKTHVHFGSEGKPALTHVTSVARNGDYSLVVCHLYTGRTNQIRVHLAAAGHWIIGDKLYYPDENIFLRYAEGKMSERDSLQLEHTRMLLHAQTIRFVHPVSHQWMVVTAPVLDDMLDFIRRVRLHVP